ncbi:MAG: leucyl aminopeptidase family protein, partial [Pseudomonadota bacterium]
MNDTAAALDALIIDRPRTKAAKPIYMTTGDANNLPPAAKAWLETNAQAVDAEFVSLIPGNGPSSTVDCAVLGLGSDANPFAAGRLTKHLLDGTWYFENIPDHVDADQLMLGYLLGSYSFDSYKKSKPRDIKLHPPKEADLGAVLRKAKGVYAVRNLVNTPANDMGPDAIEAAARAVARTHKANVKVVSGDDLLSKDFPLIHAVGRAAAQEPRLVDIKWGRRGAPKLTLVGKGVAYDTGGLNIKPGGSMRNMKKDMGGAAH